MPGIHLEVPRPNSRLDRVSRNDSFKSERSDKKVSFNKDVGVKRIPRGQRHPSPAHTGNKGQKDEWAKCAPVHRENPRLSSVELERQAEDLVRLLDQVDCVTGSQPIKTPSLERSNRNNNKEVNKVNLNNSNNSHKNNLVNGDTGIGPFRNTPKKLENSRTKNPINSPSRNNYIKERTKPDRPFMRRSISAHPSTNDVNGSDTDNTYEKYSATYKSVPDIPTSIQYNNYNKPYERYNHLITHDNIGESKNFMSVDNIYNENEKRLKNKGRKNRNYNEYKSADNLTDISIPGNRKLHEYKSVENLQSGYSSSTNELEMIHGVNYKPKVSNIVRKFNAVTDEPHERIHTIMFEEENSSPRKYREPSQLHFHNNNKPFSYTGAPLSSVEAVRRLSPTREIPNSNDSMYAKVNKGRSTRSTSKEPEQNVINSNGDYSAKIIITNNDYPRYDGDDDAYETYQVGGDNLVRQIRDLGLANEVLNDDYKQYTNANMNMSSVGVQTDRFHKAAQRGGRTHQSSPSRYEYGHKGDYNNDLSSASLVRRINHGFGRTDRSPSPPPRIVASHRKIPRNVVPLLSDTDDSEFNYRGRRDPMAKIRDQVNIREKIHERSDEGEEEYFNRRPKSIDDLDSSGMQPLTVDDVGALPLEVDKRGRNTLIVARQGHLNNSSRVTSEQLQQHSQKSERVHSATPRGRNHSLDRSRDKSASPSRANMSTLERMKKTFEKGKSSLDRNDANMREKKKKKIKIKFYYDPKLQEESKEDPLNRYTEYKGTSSDERSSPLNKYVDYASDPYDSNYRDSKNELRDDFHRTLLQENYNEKLNRSRAHTKDQETKVLRTPRESSRESSKEKERDRSRNSRHERDSSNERLFRQKRIDSRENRDNRRQVATNPPNYSYDSSLNRRERRTSRENLHDSHDFVDTHQKKETREEISSNKRFEHTTTGNKFYANDSRLDYDKDNRYKTNKSFDQIYVGGPDHHATNSLSDKYRSLTRNSSPPRKVMNSQEQEKNHHSAYDNQLEDKQEKIMRQRKKFFGVLKGEGRDKGLNSSYINKGEPSTLPRTTPRKSEISNSSTLIRNEAKSVTLKSSTKPKREKKPKKAPAKKKSKRQWPWSFLGLRGAASRRADKGDQGLRSRPSSRASSKASSVRSSSRPTRPTIRAVKIRRDGFEGTRHYNNRSERDSEKENRWGSKPHSKIDQRKGIYIKDHGRSTTPTVNYSKRSADSSPSSAAASVPRRVGRAPSFKQRYFGDSDIETSRSKAAAAPPSSSGGGDYRSLPLRKTRSRETRFNMGAPRRALGGRAMSPGNQGSAGSSLQSSESEADSHGGSHASRQSRASHVSTGSNRSVYLHATSVADIPVRRSSDEAPSDKGLSKQSKKVSRSFSLLSPWKPRHYREKYEVEYDNRDIRDGKDKSSLPPRPPRKQVDHDSKNIGRSQTVYKDSKLTGWLKRKKNKDIKGI